MAQQKDGVNQHKAMAMGRPVTGMKKGGAVKSEKSEGESKAFQKREGAKGERAEMLKKGGKVCK